MVDDGNAPVVVDLKAHAVGLVVADRDLRLAAHEEVFVRDKLLAVGEFPAPDFEQGVLGQVVRRRKIR